MSELSRVSDFCHTDGLLTMSISPALKASARSAYRTLYRAASSTFAGKLFFSDECNFYISNVQGDTHVLKGIFLPVLRIYFAISER